jgi:hypothetical protein
MPAQHQIEYCRVDKQGNIFEGPMVLPQDWGSISGFKHLRGKDLTKHGWYPLVDDGGIREGAGYNMLFLPEHGYVVKVPLGGPGFSGSKKYAMIQLYRMFAYFTTTSVYSDVLGELHLFPNTEHEQRHRQNCLLVEEDYVCMAENIGLEKVRVTVPHTKIKVLIRDAVVSYNKQLERLFRGMEDIQSATDAQLVAILDTNMADYYG